MGSGISFFTNATNVTPGGALAWTDIDLSGSLSPGASGAVFILENDSVNKKNISVRKNGQAFDFATSCDVGENDNTAFAICGVDGSRVCEGYVEHAAVCKILLIGETDSNVVFMGEPQDYSLGGTGSWTEIDLSGDVPAGATGAIIQIINKDAGATGRIGLVRCNNSTDDFSADGYVQGSTAYGQTFMMVAVDGDRKIEGYISDTDVDFYLVGYTKSPVTMFTNGVDMAMGTEDAWTNKDITGNTSATADGAIFIGVNADVDDEISVRKDASTDDYFKGKGDQATDGLWCGLAVGQIFEYYTGSTANCTLYLIGYCQPEVVAAQTMPIISDAGIHSAVFHGLVISG